MHSSLDKFKQYEESKHLRKVVSPCGKLVLWNYTDKCTYDREWNETTLNARGTVYEISTGKVIARAFPKFFNFGELPTEKQTEILKSESFESYEKMDGSLGIIYFYDGEWRVNTRGSFTSDQAVKGKEMLQKYRTDNLLPQITYLAEIIYPENKIIVDYRKEEKLTLLAGYNVSAESSGPVECSHLFQCATLSRMEVAQAQTFVTIEELQAHLATLDHTEEGYVVRLANGERVKFKSKEYLKVAKLMNYMSPLSFHESMIYGVVQVEFLEHLPEEFRAECNKLVDVLEEQYLEVRGDILDDFNNTLNVIGNKGSEITPELRKKLGIYLKQNKVRHSGAMFPLLLNKGLDKYIMNYIKPIGNVIRDI